jgi:type I restriction enzyme S subunit
VSAQKRLQATARDGGIVDAAGALIDHLDLWTGAVTKKSSSGRGSNGKIELTGIKKLRELILELAVRGKLVEQYPWDTPTSQLLEQIAERRRELIASKKIKNSKPLPPVAPDEAYSDLPDGWIWTRLGAIAEINPRNAVDDSLEASFIPMPLITTSYHGEHGDEPRSWGEIKKGYTHFANGDVGLAKITPCFENSKAVVFRNLRNGIGAGTTELHVARPLSSVINPYFLLLFLKSPRFLTEGEKVMTGSAGQKRVPKNYFAETPLPLPPEEEQHRIVQKVDELMALCDRLEQQTSDQLEAHETLVNTLLGTLTQSENAAELADNWARLAAHFDTLFTTEQSIDKLKQTILQLAVMGRLVEQDAGDESALTLLQSIEDRKAELIKTGAIKRSKTLPPVSDEERPFELPIGWECYRLGELVSKLGSGSTPRGGQQAYVETGVPFLRSQNVWNDGLKLDDIVYILEETHARMGNTVVYPKDILLNITGASLGRSTIFPDHIPEANVSQHVTIIRLIEPEMTPFVHLCIQSPLIQRLVWGRQVGMAIEGLSKKVLERFEMPIPPLAEQHRIVQKVDELMALCDQLKERLNQASETRRQLAEAVVSQAVS